MTDGDIPEARRLANLLEQSAGASSVYRDKAAAELRRLYKEHAALEAEYKRLQKLVTSQGIRLMEYESEQPEQEPVAWMYPSDYEKCLASEHVAEVTSIECTSLRTGEKTTIPLYTQPQRCPNCASLEAQNTELDKKLAEMEKGEPVAWADTNVRGEDKGLSWTPGYFHTTPLYTSPQRREWIGLTDEEVGTLTVFPGLFDIETPLLAEYIPGIEAKLREKNK